MKTVVLIGLLIFTVGSMFGLSSYTDTELFTLDTVAPTLDILSPIGGETWYLGDTHDITWTATDTNLNANSVYLWYSLNGGTEYISLTEAIANSGSYSWLLPATQSYNAKVRIRISDIFGNINQKNSSSSFSITYVPPAAPEGVNVNTSSGTNAVITWQPVTQTIPPYNSSITPDGYIVLFNETPYEDDRLYYFLGRSFTNSYTHHDVAEFRSQMFYRVVAYKNYRGNDVSAVEQLSKDKPLLWKDALDILHNGGNK